jgi:enamine deaminase RidA (YjgF/YER057c/UK114 family)
MIDARLKELKIDLPAPMPPAANYVPFVKTGSVLLVSGQLPLLEGELHHKGKVGRELSLEEGQEAARLCGLQIIAQVKEACGGDLNRVHRCLRLGGFVNSTEDFTDQHKVINGASDLMLSVFGEKGKHVRLAVGVAALPLNAAVEIEALFEVA